MHTLTDINNYLDSVERIGGARVLASQWTPVERRYYYAEMCRARDGLATMVKDLAGVKMSGDKRLLRSSLWSLPKA